VEDTTRGEKTKAVWGVQNKKKIHAFGRQRHGGYLTEWKIDKNTAISLTKSLGRSEKF